MNKVLHTKFGTARVYDDYYEITSVSEGNVHKKLHRLIYEDFYGVKLPSEIVVHHSDGNKLNNCILNLEAMTKSEHSKLHMKGNAYNLGNHHSEETKKKQSLAKTGVPHSDEIKIKLSSMKNTTGYFRVSKKKRNNDQGFAWRYRVHSLGKDIVFESKDIESLKQKVLDNGYEWIKLDEVEDESSN